MIKLENSERSALIPFSYHLNPYPGIEFDYSFMLMVMPPKNNSDINEWDLDWTGYENITIFDKNVDYNKFCEILDTMNISLDDLRCKCDKLVDEQKIDLQNIADSIIFK